VEPQEDPEIHQNECNKIVSKRLLKPPIKAMVVPMSVPSATTRGGGDSRQEMNGHVFFGDTLVLTAE
jgi:hypothetical protein